MTGSQAKCSRELSPNPFGQALLWEAFFVDGLGLAMQYSADIIYRILLVHWQTSFSMWVVSGAQPRRPADWRQERVPADLTFSLGQELGTLALETVMRLAYWAWFQHGLAFV